MPHPTRPSRLAAALLLAVAASVLAAQAPATRPADGGETLGSIRHARVALPMDGGPRPVTFLAGRMSDEHLAQLEASAPNVRILVGLSREEALGVAGEVHGMDGRYCSPEMLAAAPNLAWVQSTSAGVERYIAIPELRGSERIVLTNMQGVHGPTIADHVFGMLLGLTRDLPYYTDPQQRGTWNRGGSGAPRVALQGRTLLVVGLGGIGREVAKRGKGFGMRVLATRRSAVAPPPYVDRQGTPDELPALLAESDVVVLCVPLTDETRGMISARELALIRPGGYLVNIARGPVVDSDALVRALEDGHLAGAGLDVTDPEPLPPDHALWRMPNVIITPHVAARSELTGERWWALYIENLRRFGNGEPLLNVVDMKAGY
jgi:phosphoglycerate dehydrogenase-like enzyme